MKKFFTTLSIGIALYPLDSNSLQELINNAGTAHYRANAEEKIEYVHILIPKNFKRRPKTISLSG